MDIDVDMLKEHAKNSKTYAEFLRKVGYKTYSSRLRKAVKDNNIDVMHLKNSHNYIDNVSDKELETIINNGSSWKDVLSKIGYVMYKSDIAQLVKQRCDGIGISYSKIDALSKGHPRNISKKYSLDEICIENSFYTNCRCLAQRLVKELKWERKCSVCKLDSWMDKPIPIQLDHINGKHFDHRIENLRLLCPNCHAQTDTYCGKNLGNREQKGERPSIEIKTIKPEAKSKPKTRVPVERKCPDCGEQVSRPGVRCTHCYIMQSRHVVRPSYEELKQALARSNFLQVGKKYGVSDNAIRKWLKMYEKENRS